MSRFRMLRLAAISWLPVFAMVAAAHGQAYNVATDWASTYPTTASVAASTTASWGLNHAWSSGVFSWNWTNSTAVKVEIPVPFSLNKIWNRALEKGRMRGIVHRGAWFHVGTPAAVTATPALIAAAQSEMAS